MTELNQVFLLFYAVLYGALFTITDKWRPLLMGTFGRKGLRRLCTSVVCYGFAPVSYFVLAFWRLSRVVEPTWYNIPLSIFCVAPLIFFHCVWIWWVVPRRNRYYEAYHLLNDETLRAAIKWTLVGGHHKIRRAQVAIVVILLVAPLLVLLLL